MKKLAAFSGRMLAATGLLPAVIDRRGRSFVLMFHGVGGADMPLDEFERLLDELGQWFEYRPLDDLSSPQVARGHSHADRPRLYLTFDDGLRNNFSHAYPALKQRGIPATFYVCPDLIDRASWIWTYEVRERLKSLASPAHATIDHPLFRTDGDAEALIEAMKNMPTTERRIAEEAVRTATPRFVPNETQRLEYDLMNWEQIAALDPTLITIGSHTMTHAMLGTVDDTELEREVATSRSVLEAALGREVAHFCYPGGKIGPSADALVRRTYRTAVTTIFRALPRQGPDLHLLPRFRPRVEIGLTALALAFQS